MYLILRLLINAAALLVAATLIHGFVVSSVWSAIIAAFVLGILNAVIRPVLLLLTLPINILTLGLFTFVVNALLVLFMSTFVKGIEVQGFLPALFVAIILWAFGVLTNSLLYVSDHPDRTRLA